MRLRNNPDAKRILDESHLVIKKFPIQLASDTVIELGMGKGTMLTTLAKKEENKIFIGVEKYATVAAVALKKANEMNLTNFFILNIDINDLNEHMVGKAKEIWLTFSDPWPKARHEKRRLTHKRFLEKYKELLHKDGVIKLKTDNDNFFNYSLESLKENGFEINVSTNEFHKHEASTFNVMTDFEEKWSTAGKSINYLEAVVKK